jgi:hypothetical protein
MAMVVVMVVTAAVPVPYDAAVILRPVAAGRIIVSQNRRRDGREESRADGGDQETLHSLFL